MQRNEQVNNHEELSRFPFYEIERVKTGWVVDHTWTKVSKSRDSRGKQLGIIACVVQSDPMSGRGHVVLSIMRIYRINWKYIE